MIRDGLAGLHAEIAAEKAGALGRIAEKLEARLAACAGLAEELAGMSEERTRLLVEYESARQDAKLHYWYLVVQREAIGLYNHAIIARMYPMPRRIAS